MKAFYFPNLLKRENSNTGMCLECVQAHSLHGMECMLLHTFHSMEWNIQCILHSWSVPGMECVPLRNGHKTDFGRQRHDVITFAIVSPVWIIANNLLVAAVTRWLAWFPWGSVRFRVTLSGALCCSGSGWCRARASSRTIVGITPVAGTAPGVKDQTWWAWLLVGNPPAAVNVGCAGGISWVGV